MTTTSAELQRKKAVAQGCGAPGWHAGQMPIRPRTMDADLLSVAWNQLQEAAFLWLSDLPISLALRDELRQRMALCSPAELAAFGARLRPLLSDSHHVQSFMDGLLAPLGGSPETASHC
jgi:hypothetical protein